MLQSGLKEIWIVHRNTCGQTAKTAKTTTNFYHDFIFSQKLRILGKDLVVSLSIRHKLDQVQKPRTKFSISNDEVWKRVPKFHVMTRHPDIWEIIPKFHFDDPTRFGSSWPGLEINPKIHFDDPTRFGSRWPGLEIIPKIHFDDPTRFGSSWTGLEITPKIQPDEPTRFGNKVWKLLTRQEARNSLL